MAIGKMSMGQCDFLRNFREWVVQRHTDNQAEERTQQIQQRRTEPLARAALRDVAVRAALSPVVLMYLDASLALGDLKREAKALDPLYLTSAPDIDLSDPQTLILWDRFLEDEEALLREAVERRP